MNTDMIDRWGMLDTTPEVIRLIAVIHTPVVGAASGTYVKFIEIALRYQLTDVRGILFIGKDVLLQRVLVDS